MRRAAKIDENQPEIVAALRAIGCSVQTLAAVGDGCPDLLVGYNHPTRGRINLCLEVKDGTKSPSRRRLTPDQEKWHGKWRGQVAVIETVEQAMELITGAG